MSAMMFEKLGVLCHVTLHIEAKATRSLNKQDRAWLPPVVPLSPHGGHGTVTAVGRCEGSLSLIN